MRKTLIVPGNNNKKKKKKMEEEKRNNLDVVNLLKINNAGIHKTIIILIISNEMNFDFFECILKMNFN